MGAMDLHHQLPFEVGQQAESKSFTSGYRGAWFRCKIKSLGFRKGQYGASLEFFDYPEEKITWTNLFQKPPRHSVIGGKEKELQLMVRPCFPPFYPEDQIPVLCQTSGVIAIVGPFWKIGDLVDWWCDDCYWSGRVTHLLENNKVQLELPEPPFGEGKSYEASTKDLRPSLDWSLEHGWTVPKSRECGSCYCARLIQPSNEDNETQRNCNLVDRSGSVSLVTQTSISSNVLVGSLLPPSVHDNSMVVPSTSINLDYADSLENSNHVHDYSSSHDEPECASGVRAQCYFRSRYGSADFLKRARIEEDGRVTPIKHSGTIESSIMELEELSSKIRWLKELLQFGFQWSDLKKPSWRFLEAHGS